MKPMIELSNNATNQEQDGAQHMNKFFSRRDPGSNACIEDGARRLQLDDLEELMQETKIICSTVPYLI
jgi:hypothetical protein